MELLIDDSSTIGEIQREFSRRFPFLKLEFFESDPFKNNNCTKKNLVTNSAKTLGEIRHVHLPVRISINGHQKVSTLEQHFRECGINIQVFRKSGNTWLQTTTTDNWTLTEQNKRAEEMESAIKEQAVDYEQYYEQL